MNGRAARTCCDTEGTREEPRMPDFHIVAGGGVEPSDAYGARGFTVDGDVTARVVSPPDFSLWLVTADLSDGTTIEWPARHGDEAVYVLDGALEIDGKVDGNGAGRKTVPPVGAAVIEADAPATARAVGA